MLDIEEIMRILPHRFPFLMVDRIVDYQMNEYVKGYKNITMNEPWVQGHFPGNPIFPGVMILETMVQIGGFAFYSKEKGEMQLKGYLVKADKVKFTKIVKPGDCLVVEGRVTSKIDNLAQVITTATVEGIKVASGVITYAFN